MIRIPSLTHSLRYTKPTVHRGVCPRKPQSEVGRILRIPRYDRSKIEKPKVVPYYICPDQYGRYAQAANDNAALVN